MELKKSRKADLEEKKTTFFLFGVLMSLLAVFLAFEYVGTNGQPTYNVAYSTISEEVIIDFIPAVSAYVPLPLPASITVVSDNEHVADIPPIDAEDDPDKDVSNTSFLRPVDDTKPDVVTDLFEIQPEFPGGEAARLKFLEENVKYPKNARRRRIEGTVTVCFIVEKDGSISNVKILNEQHASLQAEALRVMQLMPKWRPGVQNGKLVTAKYNMPITFRLKH